jgi:hypothetical protein
VNRHRRYLIGLAVALAVSAVLVALLTPRDAWVALDERRSSLRTTRDGVAAWSRSLARLDVPVSARFASYTDEEPRGAAIVLLEPLLPLSAAEVGTLLQWVRGGGTLVYSPAFNSVLSDSLGVSASLVEDLEPSADREGSLVPHRWTQGVVGDADVDVWVLEPDSIRKPEWVPLATAGSGRAATLAWMPVGAGGVLALAEGAVLSNETLAESTLPVVVTRALADVAEAGDTVFFDEYHQGLDGRSGLVGEVVGMAADSRAGRAAMHLALAGVVLLFATARPFGAPAPPPEGRRRSPLEHVDALGRIYEIAGSERSVARRLVHGAARRVGMRARTDQDEEEVIEGWRSQPHLRAAADLALAASRRDPLDLSELTTALDAVVDAHTSRSRPRERTHR